jgi:hypothetical protein
MAIDSMALALGRYLLVLGQRELRCYDLDIIGSDDGDIARPIATYGQFELITVRKIIVDKNVVEHELVHGSQLLILCVLMLESDTDTIVWVLLPCVFHVSHLSLRELLDLHIAHDTARFELKNRVHLPGLLPYIIGTLEGNFLFVNDGFNPIVLHVPTCQLYHLPPSDPRPVSIRYLGQIKHLHDLFDANSHLAISLYVLSHPPTSLFRVVAIKPFLRLFSCLMMCQRQHDRERNRILFSLDRISLPPLSGSKTLSSYLRIPQATIPFPTMSEISRVAAHHTPPFQ